MKNHQITVAAIYSPGKAIFGEDLLHLTMQSKDAGINLTGADIRKAWPADIGGFWVECPCENKHYASNGEIDN